MTYFVSFAVATIAFIRSAHGSRPAQTVYTEFANGKSRENALVGYSEQAGKSYSDVEENTPWCVDRHLASCKEWADSGECQRNPNFMNGSCPKSCGSCASLQIHKRCEERDGACRRVFLDVSIEDEPKGRIWLDLFDSVVPKTAQNFFEVATREHCGYKDTVFYRIIPGFMNQGGRACNTSIYGASFADENFDIKFDEPYLLSMANAGPNTNGVDFFITVGPAHHLDDKFVVLGTVVKGFDLVEAINKLGTNSFNGDVHARIKITDTGQLPWTKVRLGEKS